MPHPSDLAALIETAEAHTRAGRLSRAVVFYRKVLARTQDGDFRRELAHLRLGDVHLGQGRSDLAVPHLRRAYALSGGDVELSLMLGQALLAAGQVEEAAWHLQDALCSPVRRAEALAALAGTCLARGDREGAGALARQAAAHDACHQPLARALADA